MQRRLEFACAAAALNCMGVGARGGIEPVENIERLMATGARHAAAYELGK
jgi:sulfofructose kinase